MSFFRSRIAAATVALVFLILPATTGRAQEPAPEGEAAGGEKGMPVAGYLGAGVLAFLALFIVAKSARR